MELPEDVVKYEASLGDAMMKYGTSNETGKMLAMELLAREMQARELLAREMGSHTDSQDRRKKSRSQSRKSKHHHSSNHVDSFCGNSVALSLDGSLMSRSRWEPNETDPFQHESASLPAEFLYFKFEQMVARWASMRMSSAVSLERFRPHMRNTLKPYMSRLPKTITTIGSTNQASSESKPEKNDCTRKVFEKDPSEDEKNLPRFMRSTNTSATRNKGEIPQKSRPTSPQKKTTKQRGLSVDTRSTSKTRPTRGGVSSSPASRKQATTPNSRRRSPSPYRTSSSPMQMTESQKQKRKTTKPPTPKFNSRSSNDSGSHSEARGPQNTVERDAPHYQNRDLPASTRREATLPNPEEYHPNLGGQRWQKSAVRNGSSRVRSLSPRPSSRSATPDSRAGSIPRSKQRGASPSPVRNSSKAQTMESPNPTTRRRKSRLPPIPSFRNPSQGPQRQNEKVGEQKELQTDTRPQLRSVEETGVRNPMPHTEMSANQEDQPPQQGVSEENLFTAERESSPSKRISEQCGECMSPTSPAQTTSSPKASNSNSSFPASKTELSVSEPLSESPKKRTVGSPKQHASPQRRTSQVQRAGKDTSLQQSQNLRRTSSQLNTSPQRISPQNNRDRQEQHGLSTLRNRQTRTASAQLVMQGKTRQAKASPQTRPSLQPRRYRRMHTFSATVIQSFRRMLLVRQRYLQMRSSVVTLQSLCRRTIQVRAYKRLVKGRRLRNFSAIIIQKSYRMATCRSCYIQLRNETIVIQSAARMFLCKSSCAELRIATKKLSGGDVRTPTSLSKSGQMTVRGGRLRIYSALLIQSLARMRLVRTAYLEILASAKVIQRWFRGVHKVIKRQNYAATVIQSMARMASYRECYLDLRANVILLQAYIRMMCVKCVFTRLRVDTSAKRIQALCRKNSCQAAYNQLRVSTGLIQVWMRGWATRIYYLKMCSAVVSVQRLARKYIVRRIGAEKRAAITIQAAFRSYLRRSEFLASQALLCIIQSTFRGHLQRKKFLMLRSAALSMQTAARRSVVWAEKTKLQRSKMHGGVQKNESINSTAIAHRQLQYDSIMSAALAFVSTPSNKTTKSAENANPSVFRSGSQQSLPSPNSSAELPMQNREENTSFNSTQSESKIVWEKPGGSDAGQQNYPLYRSRSDPSLLSSLSPKKSLPEAIGLSTYNDTGSLPPGYAYSPPRHGISDELAANNAPYQRAPLTPPQQMLPPMQQGLPPNTLHVPALQYRNQFASPSSSSFNTSPVHLGQQRSSPHTPNEHMLPHPGRVIPQARSHSYSPQLPNNLVPAPPDLVSRMSPSGRSVQPLYFISQSPNGASRSPQIYALQPISGDFVPRSQSPSPYCSPPSQMMQRENVIQFDEEQEQEDKCDGKSGSPRDMAPQKEKMGRKGVILEGLKRDRTNRRTPKGRSQRQSFVSRFASSSPLRRRPDQFHDENTLEKRIHESNARAHMGTSPTFDTKAEKVDLNDLSESSNPWGQAYQNTKHDDIRLPPLKREEDSTDKAISEKLAAIKKRTRLRTIQRWSKQTQNEGTKAGISKISDSKPSRSHGNHADHDKVAVRDWAKQTIQRRKKSIFTSSLDTESATQIQSIWRSHRAELLLAGEMLQTWHVAYDFNPDTVGGDRHVRNQAYIIALNGAFSRISLSLSSCRVLKKGSLVLVQWEGFVPARFSKVPGLSMEDTCCTVSVQCSAKRTNLLQSWSDTKCGALLAKAALEKDSENQQQKLRRSSIFEKSLTNRRRMDWPSRLENNKIVERDSKGSCEYMSDNHYHVKATIIQRTYRKLEKSRTRKRENTILGVPDAFQQRMRVHSAVLLQSWYRMCRCRSMYQGLRRIQSRISRYERDGSPIKFHRFFEKHTCETITEEGFECVDPPPSSGDSDGDYDF